MGEPIDVLTTLRKAANSARMNAQAHPESRILRAHAEDVEESRAAVAELIEVINDGLGNGILITDAALAKRLVAALTRVVGATP
jgi:hypothetical protein